MDETTQSLLFKLLINRNLNIDFLKENSDVICINVNISSCLSELNKRFILLRFNKRYNTYKPINKFNIDTKDLDRLLERIMLVYGEEKYFNDLSEEQQLAVKVML